MLSSIRVVTPSVVLVLLCLGGQPQTQQAGEIHFGFRLDYKVVSLAQGDALCQRACDAPARTEGWLPWMNQPITPCGVRGQSSAVSGDCWLERRRTYR